VADAEARVVVALEVLKPMPGAIGGDEISGRESRKEGYEHRVPGNHLEGPAGNGGLVVGGHGGERARRGDGVTRARPVPTHGRPDATASRSS
jgi:hypothetical protein